MKRIVLVSDRKVDKSQLGNLDIVRTFMSAEDLADDLIDNGSSNYLDIDSIVLMGNALTGSESQEEQLLSLQSAMNIAKMRTVMYMITKDTSLASKYKDRIEDIVIYKYFMILTFSALSATVIERSVSGKLDNKGLCLPDFHKRSEIESLLHIETAGELRANEEAQVEEDIETPEMFTDFVDSEANKKELKRLEIEERKLARKKLIEEKRAEKRAEKKSKSGFSFFGKKSTPNVPEEVEDEEVEEAVEEDVEDVEEVVEEVVVAPPKRERSRKAESKPKKAKKEKPVKEKSRRVVVDDEEVRLTKGVVLVTGDRQSGISTTVANMAEVYASNGLSTLVLDMDLIRRAQSHIFSEYKSAELDENRVKNALLVNLVRPENLSEVRADVNKNLSVVSISGDVERVITKFAGRPLESVLNPTSLMNLLSYAKANYDVVLIDFPIALVDSLGECLSYCDRVVLCVPNTETHLDVMFEVEIEKLLLSKNALAHTLLTKSRIVLTRYDENSTIDGRVATVEYVGGLLNSLDDVIFHVPVVGKVDHHSNYAEQSDGGVRVVMSDSDMYDDFLSFMGKL